MKCVGLSLIVFAWIATIDVCFGEFLRVCFFQSWARFRKSSAAKFDVKNIDPSLCTHLIYAFGKIDPEEKVLKAADPASEDGPTGRFKQFTDLKKKNPTLKTMISIGGQNERPASFVQIASDEYSLEKFASSALVFLRDRHFDGLDVDWEYPSDEAQKKMFTNLMVTLRSVFNADSQQPRLLLTFSGPAGQWSIDPGFDVPQLAIYADYALLMTYDYTATDSKVLAFNSPLFASNDPRINPTLNTNWTVHYWNSLGMPFKKIVVGFTGLGRWLVIRNATEKTPGSSATGEIKTGKLYNIPGGLAYPEICDLFKNINSVKGFDDQQQSPYIHNNDDWIGYEDPKSLAIKIGHLRPLGIAGFMFWALDYDDFSSKHCGSGRYPLLQFLKTNTSTDSSTSKSSTTIGPPSNTTTGAKSELSPSDSLDCKCGCQPLMPSNWFSLIVLICLLVSQL